MTREVQIFLMFGCLVFERYKIQIQIENNTLFDKIYKYLFSDWNNKSTWTVIEYISISRNAQQPSNFAKPMNFFLLDKTISKKIKGSGIIHR